MDDYEGGDDEGGDDVDICIMMHVCVCHEK